MGRSSASCSRSTLVTLSATKTRIAPIPSRAGELAHPVRQPLDRSSNIASPMGQWALLLRLTLLIQCRLTDNLPRGLYDPTVIRTACCPRTHPGLSCPRTHPPARALSQVLDTYSWWEGPRGLPQRISPQPWMIERSAEPQSENRTPRQHRPPGDSRGASCSPEASD